MASIKSIDVVAVEVVVPLLQEGVVEHDGVALNLEHGVDDPCNECGARCGVGVNSDSRLYLLDNGVDVVVYPALNDGSDLLEQVDVIIEVDVGGRNKLVEVEDQGVIQILGERGIWDLAVEVNVNDAVLNSSIAIADVGMICANADHGDGHLARADKLAGSRVERECDLAEVDGALTLFNTLTCLDNKLVDADAEAEGRGVDSAEIGRVDVAVALLADEGADMPVVCVAVSAAAVAVAAFAAVVTGIAFATVVTGVARGIHCPRCLRRRLQEQSRSRPALRGKEGAR